MKYYIMQNSLPVIMITRRNISRSFVKSIMSSSIPIFRRRRSNSRCFIRMSGRFWRNIMRRAPMLRIIWGIFSMCAMMYFFWRGHWTIFASIFKQLFTFLLPSFVFFVIFSSYIYTITTRVIGVSMYVFIVPRGFLVSVIFFIVIMTRFISKITNFRRKLLISWIIIINFLFTWFIRLIFIFIYDWLIFLSMMLVAFLSFFWLFIFFSTFFKIYCSFFCLGCFNL